MPSFFKSLVYWANERIDVKFGTVLFTVLILLGILILLISMWVMVETFQNDPFGTGTRYYQSRSDTGADTQNPRERFNSIELEKNKQKSTLTGNPQAPSFEERYGIDAKLDNGSVLIERESFFNQALSDDTLEKVLKN